VKRYRLIIGALLASAVVAIALRYVLNPPLHLQAAELLPAPKPVGNYGFTVDGKRIALDALHGRWVLLYLGYTSCPDVCPLELQKLGKVLKQFANEDNAHAPLVLFVSVDPERDSTEALQKYVTFFDEKIIGITGSNGELAALAGALGATYNRMTTINGQEYLVNAGADMPANSGDHYEVNHSSRIFILDPQSRYIGSFPPPHDESTMASDMTQLMHRRFSDD